MKCNICDGTEFGDMRTRPNVRCTGCGSLERTRLLWLYLMRKGLRRGQRVLHIAPEQGIHDALLPLLGEGSYVTADIEPRRYPFAKGIQRIDLCDLDAFPTGEFDLILHCHVLEHVPCNYAYTLFHLHRMLKAGGRHVFIVPFIRGRYEEDLNETGDENRTRRFGQFDHVRRFGTDDIDQHLGKLLKMPGRFDAEQDFGADVLTEANIPETCWKGFTSNAVIDIGREDCIWFDPARKQTQRQRALRSLRNILQRQPTTDS